MLSSFVGTGEDRSETDPLLAVRSFHLLTRPENADSLTNFEFSACQGDSTESLIIPTQVLRSSYRQRAFDGRESVYSKTMTERKRALLFIIES